MTEPAQITKPKIDKIAIITTAEDGSTVSRTMSHIHAPSERYAFLALDKVPENCGLCPFWYNRPSFTEDGISFRMTCLIRGEALKYDDVEKWRPDDCPICIVEEDE